MAKKKIPIYFWLRLDNNFYKNLAIKKARKMSGGDTMIVIYQKMMLSSLDTSGVIYYEGALEKIEEELALALDETEENISITLAYFLKVGLIQIDDNKNVNMLQVPALIQQETNWARYKRDQRNTQKLDNVQELSNTRPTEIEIEIEKELEIKKEINTEPEAENNPATGYSKIVKMLEENGFGLIGGIVAQNVSDELKDFAEKSDLDNATAILEKAIQISVLNGVTNFKYVLAITKKWYDQKLFTISDVEASENKHSQNKQATPATKDMKDMTQEEGMRAALGKYYKG